MKSFLIADILGEEEEEKMTADSCKECRIKSSKEGILVFLVIFGIFGIFVNVILKSVLQLSGKQAFHPIKTDRKNLLVKARSR